MEIDPQRLELLFQHFSSLQTVVEKLNAAHITWMIGGSGCLFLFGNERTPDDVDIYIANDQHDAVDKLFGLSSYTFTSPLEHVRNSNPFGDHAYQLTSHLILSAENQRYTFDFAEVSPFCIRTQHNGQEVVVLPPEEALLIKAILQRDASLQKHDMEDIQAFLAIHPDINKEYIQRRATEMQAVERVNNVFSFLEKEV